MLDNEVEKNLQSGDDEEQKASSIFEQIESARKEGVEEAKKLAEKKNSGEITEDQITNEVRKEGEVIDNLAEEVSTQLKEGRYERIDNKRLLKSYQEVHKKIELIKIRILKPRDDKGQFLFDELLRERIEEKIDPYSALIVNNLLDKALFKELTIDDLRNNYQRLSESYVDPYFRESYREILIRVAREKFKLTEKEIEKIFPIEKEEISSILGVSATSRALYNKLNKEQQEFYIALTSKERFFSYLTRKQKDIKERLERSAEFARLTDEQKRKTIATFFTQEIHNVAASIVFDIYRLASSHPNEEFSHLERHGAMFYTPSDFFLDFTAKIENLEKFISENHFNFQGDIDALIPEIEKETGRIDEVTGKELRPFYKFSGKMRLISLNSHYNMEEFVRKIHSFVYSEKRRMALGHNVKYLMKNADKAKDGFFATLKGFSSEINSSMLDEIFYDKRVSSLVQEALNVFQYAFERQMTQENWTKNPQLVASFFENLSNYEKYMIDELRRRTNLKEWEILRIVSNAQLIFLGVNYQLLHYFSYADPEEGTITGAGEILNSFYDPGMMQRRFQDPSLTSWGADWMPINVFIEKYNHEDGLLYKEAYNESKDQGRAAFFHLLPDGDWKIVRLGVDPGNFGEAGGYAHLARWRVFNSIKGWLLENNIITESEGLNKDDPFALTKAWKNTENIGIEALRNLTIHKFALGLVQTNGKVEGKDFTQLNNLASYLFDRYFSQTIDQKNLFRLFYEREMTRRYGKDIFKNIDKLGEKERLARYKELFLQLFRDVLHDRNYNAFLKKEFLQNLFFNAFSVITLERMPTKLVYLEKARMTQNGERLYDEIRQDFLIGGRIYNDFDQALKDISYAEAKLRSLTIEKMRELLEKYGNFYGQSFNNSRSEVNFVLDGQKLEAILKSLGYDQKRIQQALELHKIIIKKALTRPKKAHWEDKVEEDLRNTREKLDKWLRGVGEAKGKSLQERNKQIEELRRKLDKLEKKFYLVENRDHYFVSRLEWFAKMWSNDEFGFTFSSGDLAYEFVNFSADGPELLKRLAAFNADIAEFVSNKWIITSTLEQARANETMEPIYKLLDELYNKHVGQWGTGYQAPRVVKVFLTRVMNYFRKDDRFLTPFEGGVKLLDFLKHGKFKSSSFSQEHAGGPIQGNVYEFGPNEVSKIVLNIIGGRGNSMMSMNPEVASYKRKYVEDIIKEKKLTGSKLEKFFYGALDKIGSTKLGRKLLEKGLRKEVISRDWARELSGRAVYQMGTGGGWGKFFRIEVSPRVMLMLLVILIILLSKSLKDDFKLTDKK